MYENEGPAQTSELEWAGAGGDHRVKIPGFCIPGTRNGCEGHSPHGGVTAHMVTEAVGHSTGDLCGH